MTMTLLLSMKAEMVALVATLTGNRRGDGIVGVVRPCGEQECPKVRPPEWRWPPMGTLIETNLRFTASSGDFSVTCPGQGTAGSDAVWAASAPTQALSPAG